MVAVLFNFIEVSLGPIIEVCVVRFLCIEG